MIPFQVKLKAFMGSAFDFETICITPGTERKSILDVCQVTSDFQFIFLSFRGILFLISKSFHSTPTHQIPVLSFLKWILRAEKSTRGTSSSNKHPKCSISHRGLRGDAKDRSPGPRREAEGLTCFDHANIIWFCWIQVSNTSFFSYVFFSSMPDTLWCKKISHYTCVWGGLSNLICFHHFLLNIFLIPQPMPIIWWFSWEILHVLVAEIQGSNTKKSQKTVVSFNKKQGKNGELNGLSGAMMPLWLIFIND